MKSRVAYLAAGAAALVVVVVLAWFDLTIPLNVRQPVVSPDGDYFAYFDRAQGRSEPGQASDLIISTVAGDILSRYSMAPGRISWSNAGHLMVERENQATLIPNAAGSFVVLTTLAISSGTHTLWAQSGTKFAFIEKRASGLALAVYDLLQTQSAPVPLPAGMKLDNPHLLFWSPGGQELYFANREEKDSVLYKVSVISGEALPIARSQFSSDSGVAGTPSISPDGTKIYIPRPQPSVVDAASGAMVWKLPDDAARFWSPWSADGGAIYFTRLSKPRQIFAHEFASGADREVISGFAPTGFFADDDREFVLKDLGAGSPPAYNPTLREWLRREWGWIQVDVATRNAQSLGRIEIFQAETTRSGKIGALKDNYLRVRYGLFDPNTRGFEVFHIPTDREDFDRLFKSRAALLLVAAVYGLLGFFVFLARPESPPARALYLLSLVLMLLFMNLDLARSLQSAYHQATGGSVFDRAGLFPFPRGIWVGDRFLFFAMFLSCLPLALLRFALSVPERSRFLAGRSVVRALLYVMALLPVASAVASIVAGTSLDMARPFLAGFGITTGAIVVATAFFALLYNHRRPPDRRAREQVRWVLIALSVPVAGTLFFIIGQYAGGLVSGVRTDALVGGEGPFIHGAMNTVWLGPLWLFTPLAIGYALLAHKLFDIHLLFQWTLRYSLLTGVVAVVYVLLAGGMSWAIYGSLGKPSMIVLVVATVFTAMILAPARTRLERVIDRSFLRDQFDFKETLEGFAQGLPNISDRRTLATVTSRVVRAGMKTQTFCLFVLDRKTGKLRYEMTEQESAPNLRGRTKDSRPQSHVEFDPGEPLCRYLIEKNRPFEVEVSPYDPKLIPIFQGTAERLSKIRAAIVFGLKRSRELVGLMALGDKITDEFYNAEDIRLLQMVARQAALVIEKTEVFEAVALVEDLTEDHVPVGPLAGQFTPAAPPANRKITGCDLAGQSASAQPPGGDYYDFVEIPGEKLGLAMGGVSGTGNPAAALKASLQTQLRSKAGAEKNLPLMVRRINRQLFTSFRGAKYCSFFYGVYEPAEHRLEFVNAGHNPPIVLGSKGIRSLISTGVPLGLFAETTHDARFESLEPGSLLIVYSDGVTMARDRTGEAFGLDRLISSVTRARDLDAAGIAEKILSDVREFTDRLPLEEDRTIVILKVAEALAHTPETVRVTP